MDELGKVIYKALLLNIRWEFYLKKDGHILNIHLNSLNFRAFSFRAGLSRKSNFRPDAENLKFSRK